MRDSDGFKDGIAEFRPCQEGMLFEKRSDRFLVLVVNRRLARDGVWDRLFQAICDKTSGLLPHGEGLGGGWCGYFAGSAVQQWQYNVRKNFFLALTGED